MKNADITICVCTSGRPLELERCLTSIALGTRLPGAVIVSDDSPEPSVAAGVRGVCERFAFVRYVEGPRRGLCANRNHVIRQATSSHVSLIDDDGVVSSDFVEGALAAVEGRPEVILTGDVIESGIGRCPPTNPRFLGHFGKPLRAGDRLANIHLNCNVIPRRAFEVAAFDESIMYGYEDTDLCAQLLAKGYEIVHVSNLVNEHRPPNRTAMGVARRWQAERARFYVTIRRYGRWQRNLVRLSAFALVAPIHLGLHAVKTGRAASAAAGWAWVCTDMKRLRA